MDGLVAQPARRPLRYRLLNWLEGPWLSPLARALAPFIERRPTVFGLTNPTHLPRPAVLRGSDLYLADPDGYLALRTPPADRVRFDATTFEPEISFLLQRLVRPDDVVLDIGANVGLHTVAMARAAAQGHVYAVEPVAEMAERTSRNCALNRLTNVTILNLALGRETGAFEMNVNVSGAGLEGTSSFLETEHVATQRERYEPRRILVRRLDDLLVEVAPDQTIAVIKIDTEGFDTEVLEGGLATISRDQPIMIVEAHSRRIAAAGKSWAWFLETFPNHHVLIIEPPTRLNPHLRLRPLTAEEPEMGVNLLFLPRQPIRTFP